MIIQVVLFILFFLLLPAFIFSSFLSLFLFLFLPWISQHKIIIHTSHSTIPRNYNNNETTYTLAVCTDLEGERRGEEGHFREAL